MEVLILLAAAVGLTVWRKSQAAATAATAAAGKVVETSVQEVEETVTDSSAATSDQDASVGAAVAGVISAVGGGVVGSVVTPALIAGVNYVDSVLDTATAATPGKPVNLTGLPAYAEGPTPAGYSGTGGGQWANRTPPAQTPAAGQLILLKENGPYFYPLVVPPNVGAGNQPTLWLGVGTALCTNFPYSAIQIGFAASDTGGKGGAVDWSGPGTNAQGSAGQYANLLSLVAAKLAGPDAVVGDYAGSRVFMLTESGDIYLFSTSYSAYTAACSAGAPNNANLSKMSNAGVFVAGDSADWMTGYASFNQVLTY